jgi:hypothetical protein
LTLPVGSWAITSNAHWVAYVSDESGQEEVYIMSFPEGKGKSKVSSGGAAYPDWSGSGKELFYISLGSDLFVYPVNPKGSEIEVGTPHRLFHAPMPGVGIPFDASSDGKRLLVNHSEEEEQVPLQLVTNWPAELKK